MPLKTVHAAILRAPWAFRKPACSKMRGGNFFPLPFTPAGRWQMPTSPAGCGAAPSATATPPSASARAVMTRIALPQLQIAYRRLTR
jgi:hypothetical protein